LLLQPDNVGGLKLAMGGRVVRRWVVAAALGLVAVTTGARPSSAQDVTTAERDIASADDFRVRVSAALLLGRTKPPGARLLLERALSDAHPAVRTAASAALAALGDPAAIPTLERRASSESSPSAKAQMRTAAASLRHTAQSPWQGVEYVVLIGAMKNSTGVRGDQASNVLRAATVTRAKTLQGAVVTDGGDASLLREATSRHLTVLVLDGALQRLSQSQRAAQLAIDAQVEFTMRRMPEQMLKGTLSGAATSIGSMSALANPTLVAQLQNEAIDGAVESAMRGAGRGLSEAAK
jgi:hypothetical protein